MNYEQITLSGNHLKLSASHLQLSPIHFKTVCLPFKTSFHLFAVQKIDLASSHLQLLFSHLKLFTNEPANFGWLGLRPSQPKVAATPQYGLLLISQQKIRDFAAMPTVIHVCRRPPLQLWQVMCFLWIDQPLGSLETTTLGLN